MMFENLNAPPADPIVALMMEAMADQRPQCCNLTVGVYKTDRGDVPMMNSVRKADMRVSANRPNKSYVGPLGDPAFTDSLKPVVFPEGLYAKHVVAAQTPGSSAAFRMLLDIIRLSNPGATVWVTDPGYSNHEPTVKAAGFRCELYPYFDRKAATYQYEKMIATFERLGENDIVLFHGSCHNPSGQKISNDEWLQLADIARRRGFFVIIDMAYQGLGDGLVEDTFGLNCMLKALDRVALCYSCSKNFGLYSDRVGALYYLDTDERTARLVQMQMGSVARPTYWVPPHTGALVVSAVLSDEELKREWLIELEQMRVRISGLRQKLLEQLRMLSGSKVWDYLADQYGMFAMLPATEAQMARLKDEFAVYGLPDGRINVAAMSFDKIGHIAKSIHEVLDHLR